MAAQPELGSIFNEDYLYFFADRLDETKAERDADLVWERAQLRPACAVLDLGCGTGRLANRLARRGATVTGLDATELFLRIAVDEAARMGVSVDFREGDMRLVDHRDCFDAVVLWRAFGYFDDDENLRVLARTHRALRRRGRLVMELNQRSATLRNPQPLIVIEKDGDLLVERNAFDPTSGQSTIERTVTRGGVERQSTSFQRLLDFTELRGWLHDVGYENVEALDGEGNTLTIDSPRMTVIAQRP
jgi:SAM-dependent methyltransferase